MAGTALSEYKNELSELHADCELNYLRLQRLLVEFDRRDRWQFAGPHHNRLTVAVVERSAHTSHIDVEGAIGRTRWLGGIVLRVRQYHDAQMAEVISCQRQRVHLLRYSYPNAGMFHRDEKSQLNRFLGNWLDLFLASGWLSDDPVGAFGLARPVPR